MKKSSLGRRSSVLSQGRLSNVDRNNARFGSAGGDGKKSLIPKLCFGSKSGRSSSLERDLDVSSLKKEAPPSGLRRSRSYLDFGRTSTPCYTPVQFTSNTNSIYRNQSEGGRSSSVGGMKSARKESRPITEKSFQSSSQLKIQQFFQSRAPELLDKGSIKPMTTTMFADLVNFVISRFDKRMIVNRSNYMDEVPNICRLYNYKGKAERSWLMTVNAPHSWPHVVSFLVWLVEVYQVSEAYNVFEALYPEGEDGESELNDFDFKLLVPHLLKGFNIVHKSKPPGDDSAEINQFIAKHKAASNVDDNEIENLQKEYTQLQEELNNAEDAVEEEALEKLKLSVESLRTDLQNTKMFIYDSGNYITNLKDKHNDKLVQLEGYEKSIQALKERREKLQMFITNQEMTLEHKKAVEENIAMLYREIRNLNEEITEYQNEVYTEDIKLVGVRTAFNKLVQAYNKEITINLASLPELKDVQIEDSKTLHMDAPDAAKRFEIIRNNLQGLKTQLKTKKRNVEIALEEIHSLCQKAEDKLSLEQEVFEKLQNECALLEDDINALKKTINKDKEIMKVALSEIYQKIRVEKERIESGKNVKEAELANLEEKLNEKMKERNVLIEKMNNEIKRRVEVYEEREKAYKNITMEKLKERKDALSAFVDENK